MRHGVAKRKLNRTSSHRNAMFRQMSCSLLEHEQIKTTLPKAKDLRPIVEKLITKAKENSLHVRRLLTSRLQDNGVVKKLLEDIGPRFKNRAGGYVRIMKAGLRYGDAAPMAVIELVERPGIETAGGKKKQGRKQQAAALPAPEIQQVEQVEATEAPEIQQIEQIEAAEAVEK